MHDACSPAPSLPISEVSLGFGLVGCGPILRRSPRVLLGLTACLVLLAACGSAATHVWVTAPPANSAHRTSTALRSLDRAQLHWEAISLSNRTGYHIYVDGKQDASVGAPPYVVANLACGSTYTLGVRAYDAHGHTSALFSTTYRVAPCPGIPARVSLEQIDGGPRYYCSHGFTNACNARGAYPAKSWDDLTFFPIAQDYYYCSQPASEWLKEGLNVASRLNSDCSPSTFGSLMRSNHLWVIAGSDKYTTGTGTSGFGPETVGWHMDEPVTWNAATSTPLAQPNPSITGAVNAFAGLTSGGIAGRFLQPVFTPNEYPNAPVSANKIATGTDAIPSSCGPVTNNVVAMRSVMTCASGLPAGGHMDLATADTYWFAGSAGPASYYPDYCAFLYGGSACTRNQIGRASNYGDEIDVMRSWTPAPHVPSAAVIETGNGLVSGVGRNITPAEFNWAAWDEIVHGARLLLYFTESTNIADAGFPTTSVGGTTMAAQGTATDDLVESLAPIINSPFALNFASDNAGGYVFPTEHLVLDDGLDIMTKYYTGPPLASPAGAFGPGFYIFAAVRGSESQAMPRTVTFTLPSRDSTPSGSVQDVCACSPTRSTGSVSYNASTHSFTETFKQVSDVHIIGPFQ